MAMDTPLFYFFQVFFIITLIVVLMHCACWKSATSNDRNHQHILNNNTGPQVSYVQNTGEVKFLFKEEPESLKGRPQPGNHRELPKIPRAPIEDLSSRDGAELYATVDESHLPERHPEASTHDHPMRTERKTVQNQVTKEMAFDSDTYEDPFLCDTPEKSARYHENAGGEALPPPVPEKHFNDENQYSLYSTISSPMAASAVAGRLSADNIPFITSPLMASEETLHNDSLRESPSSTLAYTFISVRVPLEDIRAQTTVLEPEPPYSFVLEDGDQTYAEIESEANSSSGYRRLDAFGKIVADSHPPDPPPVERLRSVAQGHSRQASSGSSFISKDSSAPHSPNSESNQNCWSTTLPRNAQDLRGLYSVIDKNKKKSASSDVAESLPSRSDTVEDLYAKVLKNQNKSMGETFDVRPKQRFANDGKVSRHSWINSDNAVPAFADNANYKSRLSMDCSGGHDSVQSCSMLQRNFMQNGDEVLPNGHQISDGAILTERLYESPERYYYNGPDVVLSNSHYCDLETFKRKYVDDEDSEPGYEKVNRGGDMSEQVADSPYEAVSNPCFGPSNPDYQSICYDSEMKLQNFNRRVEPSYWQIRPREEISDPLYERIVNQDDYSTTDPNYEKVKTGSELSYENSEPGYERVKQRSLSEDGYGYQKLKDVTAALNLETSEPGYEMINDGIRDLLPTWNSDGPVDVSNQSAEKELDLCDLVAPGSDSSRRCGYRTEDASVCRDLTDQMCGENFGLDASPVSSEIQNLSAGTQSAATETQSSPPGSPLNAENYSAAGADGQDSPTRVKETSSSASRKN